MQRLQARPPPSKLEALRTKTILHPPTAPLLRLHRSRLNMTTLRHLLGRLPLTTMRPPPVLRPHRMKPTSMRGKKQYRTHLCSHRLPTTSAVMTALIPTTLQKPRLRRARTGVGGSNFTPPCNWISKPRRQFRLVTSTCSPRRPSKAL